MMLTLLLVSLVASVSALNKGGPLLGGLVNGGVITSGPLLGAGGIIGGSGGIVGGGGLLLNGDGLGGLIGGLNTGLVGGGQPWCTCSLKCAPGQIKLNKKCNLAPLLPGSLNTCCSLLPWWVTNQNYGASLGGAGIIGGGGIIGGVSGLVGGGSGLLGPIGGIGGPIGGIVTGPVSVVSGGSRIVGGYGSTGKGYY
ncbi:shematrin-like protein 3 isoform X1 [Mytilus edulis]|uniref:shematrin-like protein 3 isoform X1 n=1 Tax=Mytilus edulis TaxID=6550 RepID=UPI0039EED427